MESIPELQSRKYELSFLDDNETAVVPEECTYSLYDLTNNVFIIDETTIIPTTSTLTINIGRDKNVLTNNDNVEEKRCFKVEWIYNNGESGSVYSEKYKIYKTC